MIRCNLEVIIMEDRKFYSVEKVAEILDVSVRTVRRLISDGELEAIKVRKSVRISDDHLDNYVNKGNRKQAQKRRFSLEGIIEDGQVDEKALDEVTKIWESRELQ
jgi:excisionase family DNA binding protein